MTEIHKDSFNWQNALNETYQDISRSLVKFAPELLGALALLLVGWLVAHLLRLLTKKTMHGLDSVIKKVTKAQTTQDEKIKKSYTTVFGQVVFWAVMLFFMAASANLVGWKMFAGWMDGVIGYLPGIFTGLVIILGGFILSNALRSAILSAGNNKSITQTASLARLAQIITLFGAIVIGVEQIGLQMHFLTTTFIVVVGALLGGACLAFGLGARTMIANTIGAQYTRKHCLPGDHMKIREYEGEVLEVGQTCIILDTEKGRAVIPAKLFHEEVSIVISAEDKHAADVRLSSEEKGGSL